MDSSTPKGQVSEDRMEIQYKKPKCAFDVLRGGAKELKKIQAIKIEKKIDIVKAQTQDVVVEVDLVTKHSYFSLTAYLV